MIPWRHGDCGHIQDVPRSGGEIECEQCGELVFITPKESPNPKSKKIVQQTFSLAFEEIIQTKCLTQMTS